MNLRASVVIPSCNNLGMLEQRFIPLSSVGVCVCERECLCSRFSSTSFLSILLGSDQSRRMLGKTSKINFLRGLDPALRASIALSCSSSLWS